MRGGKEELAEIIGHISDDFDIKNRLTRLKIEFQGIFPLRCDEISEIRSDKHRIDYQSRIFGLCNGISDSLNCLMCDFLIIKHSQSSLPVSLSSIHHFRIVA